MLTLHVIDIVQRKTRSGLNHKSLIEIIKSLSYKSVSFKSNSRSLYFIISNIILIYLYLILCSSLSYLLILFSKELSTNFQEKF